MLEQLLFSFLTVHTYICPINIFYVLLLCTSVLLCILKAHTALCTEKGLKNSHIVLLICIRYSNHPEGHIFYLNRFHLQLFAVCLFSFQGSGNSRVRADDKPANERREALQVPEGVLDFSSGSEEDECEFLKNAVDTKRGGNAATEPMSLLQHGFSKLLERVNGKAELIEDESCPSIEGSSEEDLEDQGKTTSSVPCNPDNHASSPKLQRTIADISSSGEEGRNDKRRHHGTRGTKEGRTEGEEGEKKSSPDKSRHGEFSRPVQKSYHAEVYSDESEDLDMESTTSHKEITSGSKQGTGRTLRVDCNKKRRVSIKDRLKSSEDIEMFTSSEEEHTPSKKGKRARCHVTSARTERSRVKEPGQNSKCQSSPTSRRRAGAIDSVLGQVQSYNYFGNFPN